MIIHVFLLYTTTFRDRRLGLADGPMPSHWLGSRLWGLATGFSHRAFDQELGSHASSSAQTDYPYYISIY
jgi:hypothetical protein